jgi:hypothetical protein
MWQTGGTSPSLGFLTGPGKKMRFPTFSFDIFYCHPVFLIRILIGSAFDDRLDPDPYSECGSESWQPKKG